MLPRCFDNLKGSDTINYEIASPQTLQNLVLVYDKNLITHATAIIFVTTRIRGDEINSEDSWRSAYAIFEKLLKVCIHHTLNLGFEHICIQSTQQLLKP